MAKKSRTRKKKKSAPKTRVVYRVAAPRKRKRAKKRKAVGSHTTKKTKRRAIGASTMNMKKVMRNALKGAKVGVGAKVAAYGANYIPVANPWVKNLLIFGIGVVAEGFIPDVGAGIAGKGVERMGDQLLPNPGVSGIRGRRLGRRMTADEVRMIEEGALSDRVNGVTERVVMGNPIDRRDMV